MKPSTMFLKVGLTFFLGWFPLGALVSFSLGIAGALATIVIFGVTAIEAALYETVTDYVKTEMGKADALHGARKGSVGFALTALQRRLASSPEAIYQSLRRRRERLEGRLRDERLGILGEVFEEMSLKDLLMEAIRYGKPRSSCLQFR